MPYPRVHCAQTTSNAWGRGRTINHIVIHAFKIMMQSVLVQVFTNFCTVFFFQSVLRLASQAACLYHLKYSSPLLNTTVRGFSWIWITIAITFITPGITAELVVPVLSSFWIYGLASFLPTLCSDFHWI